MNKLYLLDTNIIMRSLIKENAAMFDECNDFISLIRMGEFETYIPSVVLAEIAWNFRSPYHYDKPTIAKIIAGILRTKHLNVIDDIDHQKASQLFQTTNIKFTDCLIASSKMLHSGKATLVSYDHDFDKITTLTRLEPSQITVPHH